MFQLFKPEVPRCRICKKPIEPHRRGMGPKPPETCADCFWNERWKKKGNELLRKKIS